MVRSEAAQASRIELGNLSRISLRIEIELTARSS